MDQQPNLGLPGSDQPEQQPEPIAYDQEGRPLYVAPPTPTPNRPESAPQFVHLSRAVDPVEQLISSAIAAKHDQSVKDYPNLNLSKSEYIISEITRHPIGLALPVGVAVLLIIFIIALLTNIQTIMNMVSIAVAPSLGSLLFIGSLFIILILVGCYMRIWVYNSNKFYLTNETIIQEIQAGLFSHDEQTASLVNIEDASFSQEGIMQLIFNYGSIRLSTEGDESTYRFSYVARPKDQIAVLNNAIEAFKNGRPVTKD